MGWGESSCIEAGCNQECCFPIPLPYRLWKKRSDEARECRVFKERVSGETWILAVPVDGEVSCVFLKRGRCVVYRDRPDVCRRYGVSEDLQCPYLDLDGDPRPRGEVEKFLKRYREETNRLFKRYGSGG